MTLVMFSGGCDSTLALTQYAENSSSVWPVHALAINAQDVPGNKQQQAARKKILRELKKRGYHIKYTEVEQVETEQHDFSWEKVGLLQPHIWLPVAIQYLRKDEDLAFGYIKGDCIMHYKHELFQAFNSLQTIADKTGKLLLPYEWTPKTEIVKVLRQNKLIDFVWYCEAANKPTKPCGKCPSCLAHRHAIWELDESGVTSQVTLTK